MARLQISDTIYTSSKQPLDSKLTPLNNLSDLNTTNIPRSNRYKGMEVVVLNTDSTGIATRFILHNGTGDGNWKIKDDLTVQTNAQLEEFKPYLLEGTKIVVLTDETNKGQLTEYVSSSKTISNGGVEESVVDLKKQNNDGVITSNELALKRLNNHEVGTLIYLQDTIYSYINEEDEIVYTDKIEEAKNKENFTSIPTGFYIFQVINNQEVLSKMIVANEVNSINIPIIGDDI
jgi:hypothetical protein